jgi:hypothetical protein
LCLGKVFLLVPLGICYGLHKCRPLRVDVIYKVVPHRIIITKLTSGASPSASLVNRWK